MKKQFTFSVLATMVLLIFFGSLIYSQVPGTLYGTTGSTTNELITIDPTTGDGTLVSPISGTGGAVTEIEFRIDEILFGTVGQGLAEVVTIDPLTGVATIIGFHSGIAAVAGLDFDSGGNLLGALYDPGITTDLVTIDQTTGASTVVGTIFPGGVDRVTGLTFDAGGTLYGSVHQQGPSFLYTINSASGVPTLVGPIGFDKVGAIEFGPDGILYGGVGSGVTNAGALISINPSTGAGTLIGPTGFPAISGLSFFPGVIPGGCNLFEDTFDSDIALWTEVGPLGIGNWSWQSTNNAAGAAAGEMRFSWTPAFTGDSYIMSPVMPSAGLENTVSFQHFVDYFGAGLTVGAAYTTDAGATWTTIWSEVDPPGNVGPELVTVTAPGDANFQLGFFYSGNSFQIDFWYIDDVCVDGIVPVELTSFTASVNAKNVTLNWTTATETNNQGFEIERNSGNDFENIGYVAGFGTSRTTQLFIYKMLQLTKERIPTG